MRLVNLPVIYLIKFYKKYISIFLGNQCRFYPSCSQYSLECFQEFNFIKASLLSCFRILRCNQFFRGGYDPVRKDI